MEEISLSKLGLVTFFGHGGEICPMVTQTYTLTILHIDGFHNISVGYCGCASALPPHLQLFDGRLFPASIDNPKTAFSFELLRQYQIHHLEGKGSAYSYIQSLYRLTNDEGLVEIPVRLITLCKYRLKSSLGPRARVQEGGPSMVLPTNTEACWSLRV
jgi:CxC2 like cysteine cluster associated with KDZ transposases